MTLSIYLQQLIILAQVLLRHIILVLTQLQRLTPQLVLQLHLILVKVPQQHIIP